MATKKSLCAKCKYGSRFGSAYFCNWRGRILSNNKSWCSYYEPKPEKN